MTDAERIRLLIDALAPFSAVFARADDPGVSDLDNEQPFSLHVSLGAWRTARRVYLEAQKGQTK